MISLEALEGMVQKGDVKKGSEDEDDWLEERANGTEGLANVVEGNRVGGKGTELGDAGGRFFCFVLFVSLSLSLSFVPPYINLFVLSHLLSRIYL